VSAQDQVKAIPQGYLDQLNADELLNDIEQERRRETVLLVSPADYEKVRQAVASINPGMESRVVESARVPQGQMFMADYGQLGVDLPDQCVTDDELKS
jgi:hypothetical protein